MNSQQAAIDALQASVRLHWQAIEAYTLAASYCGVSLGLSKLAARFLEEATDEHKHLMSLADRLRAIEAVPDTAHEPGAIPDDVPGILEAALSLESRASEVERAGVLACRDVGDEISARVIAANLEGTEEFIVWLEAARRQIGLMGLDNWLSTQV